MTIIIEEFKQQNASSNIVAIFDVYLPKLMCRYRNIKLIKGKKGHFVAFPSFCTTDEFTGEKKFTPIIEYDKERQMELNKKIMEALKPFVSNEAAPMPPQDLGFNQGNLPF